jgi:hypothetical protein
VDGDRHVAVVRDHRGHGGRLTVSTVAQVPDLATFTGLTVDADRAQLLLDLVEADAASIVSPLPVSAKGVILTAAARALPNPAQVASQSLAGTSTTWGAGGLYLTRSERRTLARLAGIGGGAFSINPAQQAGKDYRDALRGPTIDEVEEFAYDLDVP